MSYFTFNMSASTQGPSTPKNPQRSSSSNSAVPQLDHDSSTLPINSSATMLCEPTVSGQTALNPEAQWSGFNSSLLQVDGAFSGSALPSYDQSTLHAALTTNDDLRWMLIGMNERMANLEQTATAGNRTMDQMGNHVSDMLSRLAVIEGMIKVVEDLKQSLRDFTRGLVPHILGVNLEEDLEKQG
ncbi:uncharacterized protein VB005_02356 [Metarhizium brunneum]